MLQNGVGTFPVSFSQDGNPSVTATDTVDSGLTGTTIVHVTSAPTQAGTITAAPAQVDYGQSTMLTVTFSSPAVGSAPMTGTVGFYDGSTLLGIASLVAEPSTGTIVEARASLSVATLPVGDPTLHAVDSGDANYSTATTLDANPVEVDRTVTSTTLTTSTTPAGATLLTAVVAVTSSGNPSTNGSVTFYDGNVVLGTSVVTGGVATFNDGTLSSGSHAFEAVYSGDPTTSASTSSTVTMTPNPTISGTVYLDLNASGQPDAGEPGLPGRVVFLDLNHDGTLDPGDPTASTDAGGHFTLAGSSSGTAVVLEDPSADTSDRDVVDQSLTDPNGSISIGVVPISAVAPVNVVPNPFSSTPSSDPNAAYVQSLYKAVLGRTGGATEVDGWLSRIEAGMTLQEVAEGFINSPEHAENEVVDYYQEFLHRAPDPGSAYWVNELVAGVSEEQVVEGILDSPEYQAEHIDSASYVQNLYIDVLGRVGDPQGIANWEAALASGASRESIAAGFVNSTEAIDQVIDSDYTAFLHRQPEPGPSPDIWFTDLEQPNGSAGEVAAGILASPEFDQDATTSTTGS